MFESKVHNTHDSVYIYIRMYSMTQVVGTIALLQTILRLYLHTYAMTPHKAMRELNFRWFMQS